MPAILLTGHPGVGKTTVIHKTVALLQRPAGGFYTREVRAGGRRTGFEIVTLEGQTAPLATTRDDLHFARSGRHGRYRVNLAGLEQVAVPALRAAHRAGHLVIVDEIGPMEILSGPFCDAVWELLEAGSPLLGTIVGRPYRFADDVKGRADVTLRRVTPANRDDLPRELASLLETTA